jgi:hypothetical protein
MDYKKANCNLIQGTKESGKSALVENLATHYAEVSPDSKILDLFGSRDNEGLSWCRSPYQDNILFVVGDSVEVSSRWPAIKVSKLKLSDFQDYKVILSVSAFYSSLKEEHLAIKRMMELLWQRTHWTEVWAFLIREIASLIYSRLGIGEDQTKAKAYVIYVLREARHMGYAVCADAIRYMSVDTDLRSLADYTYLKACGKDGLPDELQWLYSYFKPFSIMRMPINQFIIISKRGTLGRGYYECPPWHKTEKEDMLRLFNIELSYGTPINYGEIGKQVSDFEHVDMIKKRKEGRNGKPLSFSLLGKQLKRSCQTVYKEVENHNAQIKEKGYCERCKRVKGSLEAMVV